MSLHVQSQDPLRAALTFLAELVQVTASSTELQPILDWMVQRITALLAADEGSIKLLGPESEMAAPHTIVRKPRAGIESGSWETAVSMTVMGYLLTKGEPLSSPDLLGDPRFAGLRNVQTRVRSVLAVPLRVENRITGMLAVTNRTPGREWTADEIQLLTIVASNSAEAIDKARLRAEAEAKRRLEEEQERMERELAQAGAIQMSLVPSVPLVVAPFEIHGRVVPARHVGGDYFDYFPIGPDRFGITIADVSGKGISAAVLMAKVAGAMRVACDGKSEITGAIQLVNRQLATSATLGRFVTLFYGEVDTARGVLRYTNAGHNYPLMRRADKSIVELAVGGLMLGPFPEAEYELAEVAFGAGDSLLLYSDGISEAMDGRGREFGEERLRTLWEGCCALATAQIIDCLLEDVVKFRGSSAQSDDMTAVVVGPQAS